MVPRCSRFITVDLWLSDQYGLEEIFWSSLMTILRADLRSILIFVGASHVKLFFTWAYATIHREPFAAAWLEAQRLLAGSPCPYSAFCNF